MKNYERAFALILVLGAATAKADVVDLDGQTVSKTGAEFKSAYNNNTIENGTVKLTGEMGGNTGTYTIGHDAIVTCGAQQYFNGNFTWNIVDGGEYRQTSSYFVMPFRFGQDSLTLDNGKITSTSTASAVSGGGIINFGYCWNNKDSSKNIDLVNKVAIKNGSTISLSSGNLWLGGVKAKGSDTRTLKTAKTDFVVTNSSIVVTKGQICFCSNYDTWLSDKANSYVHATFGPGSEITTGQFYVNGKCPTAAISFDGATIHWTGNNSSFIGHSSVGDVYTIGEGGLTIDIPSGKTLTVDANASALKGTGGITKVGAGTVNWNKVSASGSDMHLFTGPLVVSNGVWSSSVGYKASAFRAEGGRLTLSGRLEAPEVELAATDGGTLTLAGATLADVSPSLVLAGGGTTDYFTRDKVVAEYNLDTLTIGGGRS